MGRIIGKYVYKEIVKGLRIFERNKVPLEIKILG